MVFIKFWTSGTLAGNSETIYIHLHGVQLLVVSFKWSLVCNFCDRQSYFGGGLISRVVLRRGSTIVIVSSKKPDHADCHEKQPVFKGTCIHVV